jgi:hypothetical protein
LADAVGKFAVTEESTTVDPKIYAKEKLEVIDLSSDLNFQNQFLLVYLYLPWKEHNWWHC